MELPTGRLPTTHYWPTQALEEAEQDQVDVRPVAMARLARDYDCACFLAGEAEEARAMIRRKIGCFQAGTRGASNAMVVAVEHQEK